jgi:hypothetical protein
LHPDVEISATLPSLAVAETATFRSAALSRAAGFPHIRPS